VSPLRLAKRGYCILRSEAGKVVKNSKNLKKGDLISAELIDGSLELTINNFAKGKNEGQL